jgi:hypothetical protein
MSILGGALNAGRSMAQARMTDACVVRRNTANVWDETAGDYVPAVSEIYSGVCRITQTMSTPADVSAGSVLQTVGQLELHVPVGSALFAADDVVQVTGSETRPDQVGRTFVIVAPFDGSQTTALRYKVEVSDVR